jgi:hypothetical protein
VRGLLAAGLACAVALAGGASAAQLRTILGTSGPNLLVGGPGSDVVRAGAGSDRVVVQGDGRDRVSCGAGRDVVTADRGDVVAADCEVVSRTISADPYSNSDTQHATQVEPHSASAGATIVATFQSGRAFAGAASNIGWATSTDAGRTWRSGHLPGLTAHGSPPGPFPLASDPVAAYDAAHRVWLIGTLATGDSATALLVSRSRDGLRWSAPVTAAAASIGRLAYDKEWLACDTWPRSPFYGRCYLSYSDLGAASARLATQVSDDGGLTWSAPVLLSVGQTVGVVPVVRPNGDVVVPYWGARSIAGVVSRDGGVTFSRPFEIAQLRARDVPGMRAITLPSATVDRTGRVHVVWHDCRFQPSCRANDVVISSSPDGTTWSAPRRVPTAPVAAARNAFVPAVAADTAARSGAPLAVVYHWTPTRGCTAAACRVDVGLVASRDGGRTWGRPQRLSAQSMAQGWLPQTRYGRMTGDYIGLSWSAGRAVPVYSLAAAPRKGRFRQAIAAVAPPPARPPRAR